MANQNNLAFIDEIEELKGIPSVILELITLLSGTPDPAKEKAVVAKVNRDPALAAFVLKFCNSVLLSPRTPITTIAAGLNMVGFSRYKSILMSYFLRNLYNKTSKKYIADYFWEHSVYVAVIAREFAYHLEFADQIADNAYMAGLLHDIGKLAIYFNVPNDYEVLIMEADKERSPLLPIEEKTYPYTHVETGHYLLNKWNLAPVLKDAVRYHHRIHEYTGGNEVVKLTAFANSTAHYAIEKQEPLPKAFLSIYDLSEEEYDDIVNRVFYVLMEMKLLYLD
ncbi:MAG: HDOD domain-containing protein [bacterium]|nr:HDOD domain-containing protein [bacterium]